MKIETLLCPQRSSSQGYSFSNNHVWIWELDYKGGWAPKNWCFWTALLEKTPESPLNNKEIQPVHPKGNQSWIFVGRTDAKAETPILWPPELTHRKRPWCWEILRARGEGSYRGWDVWMPSLTQWTWVWTNSRRKWRTGKPGMLKSMGLQRVGYNIATEQQYELDFYNFNKCTFQVQTSQLRVNTLKTISIRLGQGYYPLHSHPRTSYQTARCIPFSTEMTQTWQSYICISCLSFSYPQKSQ